MAELLVLVLVVLVGAMILILLSLEKKYIVMSNSNVYSYYLTKRNYLQVLPYNMLL